MRELRWAVAAALLGVAEALAALADRAMTDQTTDTTEG